MDGRNPQHEPDTSRNAKAFAEYALKQTEHATVVQFEARAIGSVPGYEIIEELHRGGQGVVFRAVQHATGKHVAIKILHAGALASPSERLRFEREVKILGELEHPNIVGIRDSVSVDGRRFLVMDFIDGESFDAYVRGVRPSVRETLEVFVTVCEAVAAAHAQGIIHRDLKPSNIRIAQDGRPFVLDFGSAKANADSLAGIGPSTVKGLFIGSLPWASPEQADGESVDPRSDVYSLGVTLYQILTGRFPYDVHRSLQAVLENIRHVEPIRPRSVSRAIDDEVETILLTCLEKEPERRYASASELALDLRRYLAGKPIEAKRDAWYAITKKLRQYRVAVVVSTVITILSLATGITTSLFYRDKARAEQNAVARTREVVAMDAFLNAMLRSVNSRSDAEELKFVDLLAKGEDYIKNNLKGQPLVEANLRSKLGDAFARLKLNDEAERHLEAAYEIRKQELGEAHADTLAAMSRLAQQYNASEKLERAESLFRGSLALYIKQLPSDHPDVVWKKMYLADVLEKRQKLDEADEFYREALDSFSRNPGEGYRNYFDAANNYLVFLVDKNRIAQAEPLTRGAVDLLTTHVGPDDPKTKHMLSNQARVLVRLGRLKEAAAVYRRLLDDHRRQYGDKKAFGAVVMYLNNLGEILLAQNELSEAENMLRQAIALQERETGPSDRTVLLAKGNLARVYSANADHPQAEKLARELRETVAQFLGEGSGEAAEAQARLGEILHDAGKVQEAEPLIAQSIPTLKVQDGPSDCETLIALDYLGRTQQALGRPQEAEDTLRQAAESAHDLPPSHWLRGVLEGECGCLLSDLGRSAEAETRILYGVATLTETFGVEHPRTQRLIARLVSVYESLEKPEEVRKYRALMPSAVGPPSNGNRG